MGGAVEEAMREGEVSTSMETGGAISKLAFPRIKIFFPIFKSRFRIF